MDTDYRLKKYKKKNKFDLKIFVLVYLQFINIITGPDIILKFLGYRYTDVNDIGLGWFTTSVNLIFVALSLLVIVDSKMKIFKLVSSCKSLIVLIFLTFLSIGLVQQKMVDQSINQIVLSLIALIKIFGLILSLDKYSLSLTEVLLKVVRIIIILMIIYSVLFFQNGFSETLIGRYQSFFSQPNTLGQFCSVAMITLLAVKFTKKKITTYSFIFYFLSAVLFTFFSQSFTNFLLFFIVIIIYNFYHVTSKILRSLLLVSIIVFSYFFFTNAKDLSVLSFSKSETIVSDFNRDLTLTGRTQIWRELLDKAKIDDKIFFGYGIGGFWGDAGAPSSKINVDIFTEIRQAHNGLVELYLVNGLFLVACFVFFLSFVLKKIQNMKYNYNEIVFFNFFLVLFIFNNIVESSFFQPKNFLNYLFIFISIVILNARNGSSAQKLYLD